MRIREENCNLVLLTGVTLVSAVIAGAAGFWEPAAVSKNRPVYAAAATSSSSAAATASSSAAATASSSAAATSSSSIKAAAASPAAHPPARLIDQTPVRVIGAPFVPNTNPRER